MERADHKNIPTQEITNSNPSKMTNIPILSKKLLKKQRVRSDGFVLLCNCTVI